MASVKTIPPYPAHEREQERIAALRQLGILETPREQSFDAISDLAALLLDMPIALVSLVDQDRVWFKSAHGIDLAECPREYVFCNHTILSGGLFEVEDATRDPRFATSPFVTGEPHVRYYAGVPLAAKDGLVVGSLCVVDIRPRRLTDRQSALLSKLGEVATSLLRSHIHAREKADLSELLAEKNRLVRQQADTLRIQKRILDCASDLAGIGAWEIDLRTGTLVWSDGMYALHEMDPSHGITREMLPRFYPKRSFERLRKLTDKSMRDHSPYVYEGPMVTAKGNQKWVRVSAQVEFENGIPVRRFGMKQDITATRKANMAMKKMAEFDHLTGLHNRAALMTRLERCSARKAPLGIILFDLDDFKGINDTCGHSAGDHCLREVGRRLKSLQSRDVFVARLGGDEFVLLLTGAPQRKALLLVAEKASGLLREPVMTDTQTFAFSASVGISARAAGEQKSSADLVGEADMALYQSKRAGRNCTTVYEPSMKSAAEEKMAKIAAIRAALNRQELALHYQAKVPLQARAAIGFEALLRWHQPDGKLLSPEAFRPALDDPQLSRRIGEFVLETALDQASDWRRRHINFSNIAINVGAHEFRDESLARRILRRIAAKGLEPCDIEIEVTENVFLSADNQTVKENCRLLRAAGVGVAFDDFGTGFASMTHLIEFPVSTIKIDRSFVAQLSTRAGTTAVVRAICELGRNLRLTVVAEGIETQEQADFLRAAGCDLAQGYLFHRPLPAEDAEAFCRCHLQQKIA